MSTFVYEYMMDLEDRWKEVDILIQHAEVNFEEKTLYDVICRSASILIVSHMEGFIKGLTKSVVHDINKNLKFSEIPVAIQRTYCKRYLGFDSKAHPAYHNNISEMIGDFSQYDNFKITHEPFIYIDNKNPKPTSIKEILERFGVDDVFKNLHGSFFDSSFESGKKITRNLERLKKIILMVSYEFPYKSSLSRFSLEPKKYKDRTLW